MPQVQTSSRSVRITTLLNGRRVKGIRIDVFAAPPSTGAPAEFSASTNDRGFAKVPLSLPGTYDIVATGNEGLRGELFLWASFENHKGPDAFSMNLEVDPDYAWLQTQLAAENDKAPTERVQDFTGVLEGPAGGTILGARIKIWKRDGPYGTPLAETESRQDGRFWAHLSDGTYVALFQEGGFRDRFVVFEVAKTEARSELWVSLILEVDAGLQYELTAARDKPPSERIQDFAGVLLDESGADIPGARIRIWKRGSEDEGPTVEAVSDQEGRFSAHLAEGTYIAVFRERGFRDQLVIFDIAKGDGAKEFQVTLRVGGC